MAGLAIEVALPTLELVPSWCLCVVVAGGRRGARQAGTAAAAPPAHCLQADGDCQRGGTEAAVEERRDGVGEDCCTKGEKKVC